ncbi:hypothetical protein L083_0041 [Actinoplanes sp. N902-109]|nr:hypothetical protein L083_0041 [Actinoplanes sp. N902-109]
MAAGTGAAQLGLGYGLGVIVWPTSVTSDDSVWLGSLGWATWVAASATVLGAVIAGRLGRPVVGLWRFALAASAAVGALLTVVLVALPARTAVLPAVSAPQTVAAGYALVGVVLGLVVAFWAVVSRPAAANLAGTATWLWVLAIAAVVLEVFWHRPSATYLASWQFISASDRVFWPGALLTLLAAFVIGVLGALPAARRRDFGIGTAASGAVGPLLVAVAFVVLAPRLTGALGALQSAYLIAPYAVLAGLAGSSLTVAVVRRLADRGAARRSSAPTGATAQPSAPVGATPADTQRIAAGPAADQVATGRAKAPEGAAVPAPREETPVRSTVAPPPSVPTVAQINPPAAVPASSKNDKPDDTRVAARPARKKATPPLS